jgi:hypothetical protein
MKRVAVTCYYRRCLSSRGETDCSDDLTINLQQVQQASGNVTETIPEDVLAYGILRCSADGSYVEDGLNPDKYTRRFVNTLMKDNQFVNGKIDAVQVRCLLFKS